MDETDIRGSITKFAIAVTSPFPKEKWTFLSLIIFGKMNSTEVELKLQIALMKQFYKKIGLHKHLLTQFYNCP